ncbi:methenyltetrahydrofolate synthase domain-containing protein isoform X7 [Hypanus sabinus]|uniref:methenyltetrahydrofolate synthase domain-containing protein isoform X7 n=1 Tax=Hypanus sabinus TaxID=79690 RepID=UPI0028C46D06|nr:methenyltetrahydrofolate synthase domain-containing protein isoform X7 [Hypanus sabinus]
MSLMQTRLHCPSGRLSTNFFENVCNLRRGSCHIPGVTKWDIRQKVWDYMEENNLANFPRPVHHRIPNFKGAYDACNKIKNLDCFIKAREVKVDPDKPLEGVRLSALQARKTLLVPTPRLRTGLFNEIVPPPGASKEILRVCSTAQGVKDFSVPVRLDAKVHIDLVVVGSVAVSKEGWRIGKGEGFADLEYSMMVSMGSIDENTVVVTTVHDCQVDSGMMKKIPILKSFHFREEQAGKDVTLKDESCIDTKEMIRKGATTTLMEKHLSGMAGNCDECEKQTEFDSKRQTNPLGRVTTVYMGNIPQDMRVSKLKNILRDHNAVPLRLNWQGAQHRAFLDYPDEKTAEAVVTSLSGLSLSGSTIRVKLANKKRDN